MRFRRGVLPGGGGGSSSFAFDPMSFFSGRNAIWFGGAIAVFTFVWEMTKDRAIVALDKARNIFFVTVDVRSHQPEHAMILEWIASHPKSKKAHSLAIMDTSLHADNDADGEVSAKEVAFTLNYGIHVLTHNGHWLWVDRRIDRDRKDSFNVEPHETLTLTMSSRHRQELLNVIKDSKVEFMKKMKQRTAVWMPDGVSWRRLCCRQKRPVDTVILPGSTMSNLVNDCGEYLAGRDRYGSRGIPWRRGYFLYGPPGTGKSSFIYSLAGEFELPVYLLNLTSNKVDDSALIRLMNSVPERSIVVVEDIDLTPREGGITLGGLLNAIDGIAAAEGRLLVITSNHPQKLPSALLRAGRIDRRVEFGLLDTEQVQAMYRRYHNGAECPPLLVAEVPPKSLSPAQLQNFFLEGGDVTAEKIARWRARWKAEAS